MTDHFRTLAAPATGEFKDRGSKFIAYAWPVETESEALLHIEALRKEHFKAAHHCFAWRFGTEGQRFRANDDGEPTGTAGKPILGQIDAFGLTNVVVVVVRYFGGTLLGASGLINAYRETSAEALRNAQTVEKIIGQEFQFQAEYALLPDLMNALKKYNVSILAEKYDEKAHLDISIRLSETESTLLKIKAALWRMQVDEIATLDWPEGILLENPETDS
ncbi:MAG: YigZ family protein [Chitinophagales bacterium]|nr:YigZ family protein [Chitinophagales bacterium]